MEDNLLYKNLANNVRYAEARFNNALTDTEVNTAIYELLTAEEKLAAYIKEMKAKDI